MSPSSRSICFAISTKQAFRYNERKANDGERFARVMSQVTGRRLTYKNLTGRA